LRIHIINYEIRKNLIDIDLCGFILLHMKSAKIEHRLIGRKSERTILVEAINQSKAQLIVVYGRRRVGKSFLLRSMEEHIDLLYLEGIEHLSGERQLLQMQSQLLQQTKSYEYFGKPFSDWNDFFDRLILFLKTSRKKKLLVLDEFQWLTQGRISVVSIFKYYWDNFFLTMNHHIAICGSISSYIVNRVIQSNALYGRINTVLHLRALTFDEAQLFFSGGKSSKEILSYLLTFGGIPKYLTSLKPALSYEQNISELCFSESGEFYSEYDKIFYKQFKSGQNYQKIVEVLSHKPSTFQEISKKLKMKSGGGLKSYLSILENADFITAWITYGKGERSKSKKYFLSDEFLLFYFHYIFPHKGALSRGVGLNWARKFEKVFPQWRGLAFEHFCRKNMRQISKIWGFDDKVLDYAPLYPTKRFRTQFDLVISRSDETVVFVEIKFQDRELGLEQITEFETKLARAPWEIIRGKSIQKALISFGNVSKNLIDTKYFDHILQGHQLFAKREGLRSRSRRN
jgi:AAA+ ATPase superfamily predicted ATPase